MVSSSIFGQEKINNIELSIGNSKDFFENVYVKDLESHQRKTLKDGFYILENSSQKGKFEIKNESSYIKDNNGTPIISRGFFEIYHDDCLAQIRQNIRLYLYHCLLWNTPYLWTSFDRLGLKTPSGENSIGLNLHVDQNPTVHPDFTTIQGVLALDDCPIERGTFVVVPGSVSQFHNYSQFVKPGYKGEFVPLEDSYLLEELKIYQQLIPLKRNNIVSWE